MLQDLLALQGKYYQAMGAELREGATTGLSLELLLIAFCFGALHALMPGHGKSVLVAYHLSRPASIAQGIGNGVLLVLTHVGSAVLLVLTGYTVIRASFGRAAQTAAIDTASAVLIVCVGVWLVWRAVRPHRDASSRSGRFLAVVTGLTPCPLTTFIMTFGVMHGMVRLSLFATGAMALGVLISIGAVIAASLVARAWLVRLMQKTVRWRVQVGRVLEFVGAAGVLMVGLAALLRLQVA